MSVTNKRFRPALLSVAIAASATSVGVFAQEEGNTSLEEITVTGFRKSLQDSMSLKADSGSIVEAVSAEDIGKLPDVSIAEALSRLPGLATQRINGRGQVISVRGLAPDFSTALLNGRQQVSSGDNRSVEFDQYPSDLLTAAVVYKTPAANLIGQGLAGTVDMRTISPLEHGERTFNVNTRYEWNQIDALNGDADDTGNRFTASYIDQFMDDKLGLAIGYSHMNTPTQGERFDSWGYADVEVNGSPAKVIGGSKPFVQSNSLERDSFIGVVEFEPSDTLSTSVDVFYSEFVETQTLRGIELPLAWGGATLVDAVVEDGLVTSGTFEGVNGVIRSDMEKRDAELFAVGWNTEWQVADDWTLTSDISHSKMERRDQIVENYSGHLGGPDTLGFVTTDEGTVFDSSLDYTDVSQLAITNLQAWGGDFVPGSELGQKGYYKQPQIEDELTSLRLSAKHEMDLAFVNSVEFGINYDTREKYKTSSPEYYFALPGSTDEERSFAPLPANTNITDLSFLGIDGIVGYDPLQLMNDGTYELIEALRSDVTAKSWTVSEDVTTAFVQFGVDSELASLPLTGNFGMQVVRTDQSSEAFSAQGINSPATGNQLTTVPVSGGKVYTEVLPSLNLNLALTEYDQLRLGMARTMARPRMDELRASSEYSLSTDDVSLNYTGDDLSRSAWSANGGNPELDPWLANAFDLSYEHYFADDMGYAAIAYFYKDLESYIITESTPMDFSGFPYGERVPAMFTGLNSVPVNGQGGSIDGFELSMQASGAMIAPQLENFGAVMSASFTSSDIDTPEGQLPGLSEDVYNLTFYYENQGFSARVSGRHRSEFLGEVSGFDAGRETRMVQAETLVDAQVGYNFEGGSLEGLSVYLQGTNLTDEPFTTNIDGDERMVKDYQRYGATYALGASYKF